MRKPLSVVGGTEAGGRSMSRLEDNLTPSSGAGDAQMIEATETDGGRKRQATIVDVATTAGVAIGTVSRYLNGHTIRRANREQIEQAIEQLGYKRNAVAAAMKTDLTHVIGLMVPVFDDFHGVMLEHLANAVRKTGRALLSYCHSAEPKVMQEALDFFASQRIDALIMTGEDRLYEQVDELIGQGTPVILYNNDIAGLPADRVFVDNRGATRRAVRHLLDLGHTRIGIIAGHPRDSSGKERTEGYLAALSEYGITPNPSYLARGDWTVDGGYNALAHLMSLSDPPTAIFAASYPMATGALSWLREQGRRVPDDLSLVSFDDVPLFRLYEPGITAIAQPLVKIADAIAGALVARLTEPDVERPRTVTLDCDIILRGSTRRCP